MIADFFIGLQKRIVRSRPKSFLSKMGLYGPIKKTYRALIFWVGKNGLKLKIGNVSAKVIVSNPNELSLYRSLDNEGEFLREFLSRIDHQTVFYDIGAHVGLWSLAAAKNKIVPKFIYCWEPEPHNFKRLRENIRINNISNIDIFPIALGFDNALAKMLTNAREPGSLTPTLVEGRGATLVNVVKGDDWVFENKLHLPSVIKIDVEGYEFFVLKGLRGVIKKAHPVVFLETHPSHLKKIGLDEKDVLEFMEDLNYKIIFFPLDRREGHYIFEFLG